MNQQRTPQAPSATSRFVLAARLFALMTLVLGGLVPSVTQAQSVCLPSPRLLTTTPMGAQTGTSVEVTITGEHLEDVEQLRFSHPGITAKPVQDAAGNVVPNRFLVSVAEDCPVGVHEARVFSRLGISSSRVFSVGTLPEVTRDKPNTTLATAFALPVDTICNGVLTDQSIDHYRFTAEAGQRVVIDSASAGIDSKLTPVLILADAQGGDLQVERRGGAIDFTVSETGEYIVKLHDLTYKGGAPYFYRLVVQTAETGESVARLPGTRDVNAFSWPPPGMPEQAASREDEALTAEGVQPLQLPADIEGRFYPAADVDTYEFTAKKGDVWWVEVASERLGLRTNPTVLVQHVAAQDGQEVLTDVAELVDIPSPIKVSSNGYSYDGPPYNVGSNDVLGKLEIKQDGIHRLQITDLFGGTRTDPNNRYRLIVRKAQPDFAVVGWALHMNLRNGDRNALSKPLALRGGATMPLEVLVIRRDGFNGDISLHMDGLPEGVTATGVKIPAGESRGIMLVTADSDAPRGMSLARMWGSAEIDGEQVTRPCFTASMKWPVPNAAAEIPQPRLEQDIPISVNGTEQAPLTILPASTEPLQARVGEKVTIPLKILRRVDHSGASVSLSTFCAGLGKVPAFNIDINQETGEAVLDLAALKTQPGEYQLAFYGAAVAKYSYHPEAVTAAEQELKAAQAQLQELETRSNELAELAKTVTEDDKATVEESQKTVAEQKKQAEARVKAAEKSLQTAQNQAKPKDIVDIVVSTPCTLHVQPKEE